MKEKEIG